MSFVKRAATLIATAALVLGAGISASNAESLPVGGVGAASQSIVTKAGNSRVASFGVATNPEGFSFILSLLPPGQGKGELGLCLISTTDALPFEASVFDPECLNTGEHQEALKEAMGALKKAPAQPGLKEFDPIQVPLSVNGDYVVALTNTNGGVTELWAYSQVQLSSSNSEEDEKAKAEADVKAAEGAKAKAEADAIAAEDALLQAQADLKAAEDALVKAETDAIAAEEALVKAEAEATAPGAAKAEEEARIQAEANAKAAQDALNEAAIKAQAAQAALTPAATEAQTARDALTSAEAKLEAARGILTKLQAEEDAKKQAEEDAKKKQAEEDAKKKVPARTATPDQNQLVPGLEGKVSAQASASAGGQVKIFIGTQFAGKEVEVYVFSEPTFLGKHVVDQDGNVTVTLPTSLTGEHRLAVYSNGELVGWNKIIIDNPAGSGFVAGTVSPTSGTASSGTYRLANTGSGATDSLVFLAGTSIVLGAASLLVFRRARRVAR